MRVNNHNTITPIQEVTKNSFTNIAEHTFPSLTGYYQNRVMHVMGSGVESNKQILNLGQ